MFSDICNVAVLIITVGAFVPLVIPAKTTGPRQEVTMDPVRVSMINLLLHTFVAVWTYNILGAFLTHARGVYSTKLIAKVHVFEWFASVCKRDHLVAVFAVDDLGSSAVSAQALLYISFRKTFVTFCALAIFFRCTLLAWDDIERFLTLALHS